MADNIIDIEYIPLELPEITQGMSIKDQKLSELALAAEDKAQALKNKAWASSWEIGTSTGTFKSLAAGVVENAGLIAANVLDTPRMLESRALASVLEPDSMGMYQQAESAKNNIANLKAQMGPAVDPLKQSVLRLQLNEEYTKLNKASNWLNQPVGNAVVTNNTSTAKFMPDSRYAPKTRLEAIQAYTDIPNRDIVGSSAAQEIREYVAPLVNPDQFLDINPIIDAGASRAKEAFNDGTVLGKFEAAKEVLGTIAEAFVKDPEAAAVKMSQSILYTLAAANPLTAAAAYGPMFLETTEKSYKDFQKAHNGKLPNQEEKAIIDLMGSLSVGSDLVGNIVQIKMVPGLQKLLKGKEDVIPSGLKADVVSKYPMLKETLVQGVKLAAIPATEAAQGAFQETADQYAAQQDLNKVDIEAVAKGGIEEGLATVVMGGVAALSSPSKVLEAGSKNSVIKHATKVTEAFKQSEAYQPFTDIKQAPVEAYRAFQATVADETTTPEQKQAALTTAIGSLVNTPQFNTVKIAENLIANVEAAGLTLDDPTKKVLLDLVAKPETLVSKVTKPVKQAVAQVKSNYLDSEITPEVIKDDPVFAINKIINRATKGTTEEEVKAEFSQKLKLIGQTYIHVEKLPVDQQLEWHKALETFTAQKNAALEAFKPTTDLVKAISTATAEQRANDPVLGSDISSLIQRLDINKPNEFSDKDLGAILGSSALNENEKEVVKAYTALRKTTSEVSANISNKTEDKFKSIADYIKELKQAITLKDQKKAQAVIAELGKFRTEFIGKAKRGLDAVDTFKKTGTASFKQIDPKADELVISDVRGVKLVDRIQQDLQVVEAGYTYLDSLYKATFESKDTNVIETKETIKTTEGSTTALVSKEVVKPTVTPEPTQKPSEPVVEVKPTPSTPEPTKAAPEASVAVGEYIPSNQGFLMSRISKMRNGAALIAGLTAAYNNIPKYFFGKSVFTESNVIETVKAKPELRVIGALMGKMSKLIVDTMSSSILQLLDQNPAVAFIETPNNKLELNKVIADAVAITAINYIGTQSGELLVNNKNTIQSILKIDKQDPVPREAYNLLQFAGKNINMLAEELGAEILNNLKLTIKTEGILSVDRKRLQHALGFMAIKGMLGAGYAKQNLINQGDYESLLDTGDDVSGQSDSDQETLGKSGRHLNFISVPLDIAEDGPVLKDGFYTPIPKVQRVRDLFTKEAIDSLQSIIEVSTSKIKPITKKNRGIPKKLKNTNQKLSKIAQDTIKAANNREYSFNKAVFDDFIKLLDSDRDALLESLGYVHNIDTVHAYNQPKVIVANRLILQEIADVIAFNDALADYNKFYFDHEIWKNSRVAIANNSGVNPQGSKLVRHLITLSSFDVTINKNTPTKDIDSIKVSIAAGFAIDPGKKSRNAVLTSLGTLINDPTSKLAIALKDPSADNVIALIKEYGLKTHTLESFKALQGILKFQETGKDTVVRTAVEIDGKTNGVAIMLSQFFGVSPENLPTFLRATGMFTSETDLNYFTAMAGKPDLYQDLALSWGEAVNSIKVSGDVDLINAQAVYFGNLLDTEGNVTTEGRLLSKYPLMTVVFGKGKTALKIDIGRTLVDNIYKKVEQLMNTSITAKELQTELNTINEHIEIFSGVKGGFTLDNYKDYLIPDKVVTRIIQSVEDTYGEGIVSAIDSKFESFYPLRTQLNGAMSLMGQLFIDMVNDYAKKNNSLVTKELIEQLSLNEFKDFLPAVKSIHAENVDEGFFFIKQVNRRSTNEAYKVETTYGKDYPTETRQINLDGTIDPAPNTFSHTGNISEVSLITGGVGGIIGNIHTFDGGVIQPLLTELSAFGVHDAAYFNPLEAEAGGKIFNEIFRDNTLKFSIANSVAERLEEISKLVNSEILKGNKSTIPLAILNKFQAEHAKLIKGDEKAKTVSFPVVMSDIQAARTKYLDPKSPDVIKTWEQFVSDGVAVPGIRTPTEVVEAPETGLNKEEGAAFEEVSILDSDVGQRALGRIVKKAEKNPNVKLTEVVRGTGRDIIATDPKLLDLLKSYSEQELQKLITDFNCRK